MRVRDSKLETRTARLKLAPRWRPYGGPVLDRGIAMLYRRNANGAGTWIVRTANGRGKYWTKAFAGADDFDAADGSKVLNYGQAQDRAKELARGGGQDDRASKPVTLAEALDDYERDIKSRGRSVNNARRARSLLAGHELLGKAISLLTVKDLKRWRDDLIEGGMSAANYNRSRTPLRAALELAARDDDRLNRNVFKHGLQRANAKPKARRMVLTVADVMRIVVASGVESVACSLAVHTMAQTGVRWSQLIRIDCAGLGRDHLIVPSSYKGNADKALVDVAVPITPALAAKLAAARGDRGEGQPLLLSPDGKRWKQSDDSQFRRVFARIVAAANLDARRITPYALRHSSICRQLLAGVPMTLVAKRHDTSAKEIEAHYAFYINDVAGEFAQRGALPDENNVVSLPRAA